VVGSANKHIARVAKFLTKYGELALFPVKLQAGPPPCSVRAPADGRLLLTTGLPPVSAAAGSGFPPRMIALPET